MANNALQFDPQYVQINRAEFGKIIGRSISEVDRLRKRDPRCPQGHKTGPGSRSTVLFVLADVYAYSALLIAEAHNQKYA